MIRLKILAEGQTEETFVRDVLAPHLTDFEVYASAFCVTTSRRRRRPDIAFKGGMWNYKRVRRELEILLAEDRNPEARLTTMFDLYGLPNDFPGFEEARQQKDPYARVELIESRIAEDLEDSRLMPYIQLHEFETLVLVDPSQLVSDFPANASQILQLAESIEREQPELINDGINTAPSKRIIGMVPAYKSRKREVGPKAVGRIGLQEVRASCPHFKQWLARLESLAAS